MELQEVVFKLGRIKDMIAEGLELECDRNEVIEDLGDAIRSLKNLV